MIVCAPADSTEVRAQLREAIDRGVPTYIRIGKKGEPTINKNRENLKIGKGNIIEEGKDIMIIAIGPIIQEALNARTYLKNENIEVGVTNMGTIKPLDKDLLNAIRRKGYKKLITLEEHHAIGGLGSAVVEWAQEAGAKELEITKIAVGDHFIHTLGNQKHVRENEGIDKKTIIRTARRLA